MKKLHSSCVWFLVLLAVGWFVSGAQAALVGPGGYTNSFGTQPLAADWSTLSVGTSSATIGTAAGLDAAVQLVLASTVNTQVGVGVNEPPDLNAVAQWSPAGFYLQTRPTGDDFNILMCTLVNNIGGNAATVTISYDFTKAGAANAEEVDGQRAFFSFTGAANSWTNIPQFSTATSGHVTATLSNTWTGGGTLYILWADDNGTGSPDPAMQIDNFSVTAVSAAPVQVSITAQPQPTTVAEFGPATFSVGVIGNPPPTFQWYRGNSPILNATNSSYTLASALRGDSGAVFKVTAANTVNGDDFVVTSDDAVLTVIPDTTPPTVSAVAGATNLVTITFSEKVNLTSATNLDNYAINNGIFVNTATLSANSNSVQLGTSYIPPGQSYVLSVSNVQDNAGNTMAGTNISFTVADFLLVDIGGPSIAGSSVQVAGGGFDLTAGGSDIGATNTDQCSFEYVQRAGDFDVKVRLAGLSLSDAWAKAGLMARADLTAGSLYTASMATPGNAGCFFQYRASTTAAPAVSSGSYPVTFPSTWLRLKRVGNTFTGYASADGNAWAQLGTVAISLPTTVYLGVAATSRNTAQATVVQVRDFLNVVSATTASLKLNREPVGPSSRKTGLAITEILYHGKDVPGFTNSLEFIELYNSQGFFEKIGGYRIAGSVDYTFPSNTVMQSGSYLVVARDPAFVMSHYGITGVLGPWDNADTSSLPNDNGTVQLRNRQGAVMLEVKYEGNNPWPIAADGAGHSLVLARPTYGEDDPRAWSASDSIGGSPGRDDPYNTDPLRSVVINEILAHTEDPMVPDFIELYNHSKAPVDLSGAWLSDDAATNKFRIPDGTIIGPTGFVYFTQSTLGFALQANGERVFLVNSNQNRVIDVIDFGAQANGVSAGRSPDGASTFRELASRTPGAPNSRPLLRDIVINELMPTPISGNSEDEYVELYNKGTNTVNLGGWKFTSGISYTFPSNTFIAPDGYLVVAKSKTNLLAVGRYPSLNATNTFGDFDGGLSGGGERVALSMPEPRSTTNSQGVLVTNTIYVVENEVTYGKGGRWGTWADGGGSSLELIDPRSDNRQPANWADSDETGKGQWVNFEFTGTLGESLGSPINDNVEVFLLGIGECLIDEVELHNGAGANLIANPGFESGASSWVFQGSHDFSTIENTGYAGTKSLHLRAASRGDNGANRVRTATLGTSASGTVTLRAKAKWVRGWPEVLVRIHGGTAEVVGVMPTPRNLGTPGARNSQAVTNTGPAIWEVQHSPALPAANEPVVITARAFDPDGPISLTLRYRVDAGQTTNIAAVAFNSTNMVDNGTGGDAVAGDGIYTATLPGQPSGVTVAFYIQGVDALNATNLFPQDVFPKPGFDRCFPNDAVARECVLRWDDVVMPGTFATYHLWLTYANSNRWAKRGTTEALSGLDNAELDGTFVYNSTRAVYNALPLYAGSPWHRGAMTTGPCGANRVDYVMNFPNDDRMLGATDFVLNNPGNPSGTTTSDTAAQTEQTSYIIFNEIGVVYNHRRYVHYFVNGSQRSTTSDRAGNFIFEDSQQPNGDMINEWFPDDTNGELYKIEDWFEFNDNGYDFSSNNDADLLRRSVTVSGQATQVITPYRFMFRKRSVGPGDLTTNYASFFSMVNAVSPTDAYNISATSNTNPIPDVAAFDAIVNYEQWMRIFAVQHTVGNWDSYGYNRGKNDYTYKGQNGRFEQMTWDIDFTMGVGGAGATEDLLNPASNPISDPRVKGMLNTPAVGRAYWRAFQDIVDGPLNNTFLDPILNAKAAAMTANNINFNPATVTTIKTFIGARRSSLQTQLNNNVGTSFSVSGSNYVVTANNLFVLSGTAPVSVKTVTVLFNNIPYPTVFTSLRAWTASLVLSPGTNQFIVTGFDGKGNELTSLRTTNLVNYTGPVILPQDALVINEIMFNPTVADASYIEIYNNSSASFDLSTWRVDGLDYTFPIGSVIPGRGFVTLVKNRAAFALAAYNSTNAAVVFGEFPGNLNPAGQTLALVKPGLTAVQDVVIDKVRYEGGAPWAAGANGQGSALQLIDPTQDNARVSNWTDGFGWKFATLTGNIGSSSNGLGTNLFMFMQSSGDVYIDDVSLVPQSGPSAGINLIQNGDFEAPLSSGSNPWLVPALMTGSDVSTTYAHSGLYSLHMVGSGTGNANTNSAVYQTFPRINTNINCALSFWYHTGPSTNFTVRTFPGSALNASTSQKAVGATPTGSNSFLVSLPAFPPLWLNEVQASNTTGRADSFGEHDPWVELYNSGTTNVPLDGYYLANSYNNLSAWAFPPGSVISNGQFLVIWADGQSNQTSATEWHTSFRLNSSTGSVALSRLFGGLPQVVDYLNYSGLGANESYGDYPDAQPFDRQVFVLTPTPGTNNYSPPAAVLVNEYVASNAAGPGGYADPLNGKYDDWFELYNASVEPANIGGFYLTGNLNNKLNWRVPDGTIIPGHGFLLCWADSLITNSPNGDLHVGFKLNKGGDSIGLFAIRGTNVVQVDAVTFGGQNNNVSEGRYPDGAPGFVALSSTTPRTANTIPANRAPVLTAISNRSVLLGQSVSLTASATDPDAGQTLTYGLGPGAPTGATIDSNSGFFHWTPSALQAPSTNLITVTATDNGSPVLSGSTSFTVTVTGAANQPPVLASISDRDLVLGQSLSFTATATDPDAGQALTFSLTTFPTGATIDSGGLFHWTPTSGQAPSSNPVTVQVADNGSPVMTDSKSFTVRVSLPPRGVIAASGGNVTLTFPTIPGKNYKVQYKDNLSEATWSDLGSSFTAGAGPTTTVNDTPGHNRFYRLQVLD